MNSPSLELFKIHGTAPGVLWRVHHRWSNGLNQYSSQSLFHTTSSSSPLAPVWEGWLAGPDSRHRSAGRAPGCRTVSSGLYVPPPVLASCLVLSWQTHPTIRHQTHPQELSQGSCMDHIHDIPLAKVGHQVAPSIRGAGKKSLLTACTTGEQ
jgi:hypothetical protein